MDVATAAGVSKGTVSKVLNGRPGISPATRKKVEAIISEIGFRPNPFARKLMQGRTGTVGLLTNDLEGRFSLPILMGAEDALGSGELSVFLCDARGDEIRERYHLRALLNRRVDGLIVVGDNGDARPSLGTDVGVPVVYALAPSLDERDTSVVTDDTGSGEMAAEHLLSRGKTRIGYVGGEIFRAAESRMEGARTALKRAGLDFVAPPLFGPWSEAWGRRAARLLVTKSPEIDGILCGSDHIARGVLDGVKKFGRAIPDEVAVMGHDNWEILTLESDPPLSSIDMNLREVGRFAAQLLFEAMDGNSLIGPHQVPGRIVSRGSTG